MEGCIVVQTMYADRCIVAQEDLCFVGKSPALIPKADADAVHVRSGPVNIDFRAGIVEESSRVADTVGAPARGLPNQDRPIVGDRALVVKTVVLRPV